MTAVRSAIGRNFAPKKEKKSGGLLGLLNAVRTHSFALHVETFSLHPCQLKIYLLEVCCAHAIAYVFVNVCIMCC